VYILVDLTIREAELIDANDTHRFHVAAAHGESLETVASVLADRDIGYVDDADPDDEHVWISADAVRAMAEGLTKPGWELHFDKLLADAKKHGWLNDDGTHIHAHLEWVDVDGV